MKKIVLFALLSCSLLPLLAQQKIVGGYFTNWSVYGRKFGLADLQGSGITQATQAFMFPFVVDGSLGVGDEVVYRGTSKTAVILTCRTFVNDDGVTRTTGVGSTDFYADIENVLTAVTRYGTPSWISGTTAAEKLNSWKALNDDSKPGVMGQFIMARNRGLETVASLGGWTLAQHFPEIANDINTRAAFAEAVADFASFFEYDAIDLDWEFPVQGGTDGNERISSLVVPAQPHHPEDPMNMVMLCKAIRAALPETVHLSICTNQNPATVANMYIFPGNVANWSGNTYKGYDGSNLADWVDRFYTMTYDYGGAWLSKTSHQAPLYDSNDPQDPDHNMSVASFIDVLLNDLQVPAEQVVMGLPFYGRGWDNVSAGVNGDGLYQTSTQTTLLKGSWDDTAGENSAAFDYGDLKDGKATNVHQYIADGPGTGNDGFIEYWSETCKVPYLYNSSSGEFISYDNPRSVSEKVKFAMSKGLAGVFTWEFSQDDRALSLIKAMADNAKVYNVTLSGTVKSAANSGISGVTVNLGGDDTRQITTDSNGNWSFSVQALKNYTIAFTRSGYIFKPAQVELNMLAEDSVINVAGAASAYAINGKVAFSGGTAVENVELVLKSGTQEFDRVSTGSDGSYAFTSVPGEFDYQLVPSSPYYVFTPASLSFPSLAANQTNQNFTLAYASYSISGTVNDKNGNPIEGAQLLLSGGETAQTSTASDGTYTFTGLQALLDYQVAIVMDDVFYTTQAVDKPLLSGNVTANFSEYPGMAVFGYVKDGASPLSGVTVAMTNSWQADWVYGHSATTNENGFFQFIIPESVSSLSSFTLSPSGATYYSSVEIPSSLSSSLRVDFNTQEVAINLAVTSPTGTSVTTDANGKVLLQAEASVASGSITGVLFEVDGQSLAATNTTGNSWEVEWTPSEVYADYSLKVTATTSLSATSSVTKDLYVDCSTNCPNQKPVISLNAPTGNSEVQASFSEVTIDASITDADGTLANVSFTVDGSAVTPSVDGDYYRYSFTPSAYKTYAIVISATDDDAETTTLTLNYEIRQPSSFTPMPDVAIVGYWHNWQNASAPFIDLSDLLTSNYTIIDISFGIQASDEEDHLVTFTPDATGYPNVQNFIDDVAALKAAGKVVLLSLGGETGHFSLESEAEKDGFVASLKTLIDTYGFDGIDIDLEGSAAKLGETSTSLEYATLTSARSKYLIDALNELTDFYGDDFVLTFAEELYYVQVGYSSYPGEASGDFLPVLYNLWDKWDLLHVQYYNYGTEWWMGADKQEAYSAELVIQELELLLTGFKLGSTGNRFPAIDPSRLAIGLPCTCSASGLPGTNDYNVPVEDMIAGLEYLRTGEKPTGFAYTTKGVYEPIRGMMTWSINWDATTDCGHTPYDYANKYYEYFSGLTNQKPVVSLATPANNEILNPGTVAITADASDSDGSIAGVDFYVDSVKVGTVASAPYTYNWNATEVGTHSLYAIAVDNLGKKGTSAVIRVQVVEPGAPEVNLGSPADGAEIAPGNDVLLTATASDSDGAITKVQFYDGETLLGESSSAPFQYNWTNATAGVHELKAKAIDNDGKTATSAVVSITVYAYHTIAGTITKGDGSAYSGVAVTLEATGQEIRYAETNASGYYEFTNVLSFNDYTISPSSGSGGIFVPEQATISNLSADASLDFELNEGIFVQGYVKNGSVPVGGAVVAIVLNYSNESAPWTSTTVSTDAYGYYRFTVPEAYVGGKGGSVKMNDWDNNGTTFYPTDGYVFSTLDKSERCDFNAQENSINVSILTASSVDAELSATVPLLAEVTIGSGSIETVSFAIDGQTISGTNTSGDNWSAGWTPSALDVEYELTVTATGEGLTGEAVKTILVNCTGDGCANKKPLITVLSPSENVEQQETFTSITVSVQVTDADGSVSNVVATVDGQEKTISQVSNTYSFSFMPTAYKTYTIVITATDDDNETSSLTKEYTVREPGAFTAYPSKCITGYWHNWINDDAPFMPLADVLNTKFNVVIVSFIETQNSDGYTPVFEPLASYYTDPAVFKAEVQQLQSAGIPVLISVGGQNGHVELSTEAEKNTYVNGVIQICETYGFDGLDIDYEGGSMTAFNPESNSLEYADITDPELKYGIDAIREIHDYFGSDFLITAAPETAYVQDGRLNYPGAGQFLPVIYNIRDILTCLHVQLYNFGSATWSHLQDLSGTPTSLGAGTADVIVGLTEMLATGFPLGSSGLTFPALREDQIAIGILASPNAGGAIHYTDPAEVIKALDYLIKGEKDASLTYPLQKNSSYPDIRGVMTWSVNWDNVLDGRDVTREFQDTYYDYFLGNQPPVAELTSPADGDTLALGNITLTAAATDPEGNLQSVAFYAGNELIGTATSSPYSVNWLPADVGTYQLMAKATDGDGKTGESDLITVEVVVVGAPVITGLRPIEGQQLGIYNLGTDVLLLKADIADEDNSLTGDVTFTINGTAEVVLVASAAADGTYQCSWTPSALGDYTLTIEATNANGKAKKIIHFSVYDAANRSLSFDDIANTSLFNDAGLYTRTVDQIDVNLGQTASFTFDQSITKVSPRAESLAKLTISGSVLSVQGYRTGRTGLQITAADGKVYLLGLRVNEADGTPPGLPDYASVGSIFENTASQMSFWTDLYGQGSLKNKNIDVLYIYYQGGPTNFMNSADPERNMRMQRYARNCVRLGVVPAFVYYNIPNPDESYSIDIENLSTEGFIDDYYMTMKVFIDDIREVMGDECFQMIIEPDFLGYMLQGSGSNTTNPASIALYGDYTVSSFVTGVNELIDAKKKKGANITFGWQFNLWADDTYNVNPSLIKNGYSLTMDQSAFDTQVNNVRTAATHIMNFGVSAGVTTHGAGFVVMDRYGNAPGETNPASAAYWFNNDQGINYLLFAQKLNEISTLPVVLWQLPTGRINSTSMLSAYTGEAFSLDDNMDWCVDFIFGDTLKPQYSDGLAYNRYAFFDDNFHNDQGFVAEDDTVSIPSHIARFKDYGIISAQFGMGLGGAGQSATVNPADDYYFIQKTQHYYQRDLAYVNDEVIYPGTIFASTADSPIDLTGSHPAGSSLYYAGTGCTEEGIFTPADAGVGTYWVTFQYVDNAKTVYKAQKIVVSEGLDTEAPVLTAFECDRYTKTQTATITTITATDNVGISGYYIAEDSSVEPAASDEGWLSSKPAVFTLSSVGEHTLYLWVKDAAGNVSSGLQAIVTYDNEIPVISAFTAPATTETASIALTVTASDNIAVTGYYLVADDSTTPEATATGWESNAPESTILQGTGDHILYLWVKDAAGNVSVSASASVTYTSNDTTAPLISSFTCPSVTNKVSVNISIEASDDVNVTGYYLAVDDNSVPAADNSGWQGSKPATVTVATPGEHTLYLWVKDAAGNISSVASASVTYILPETAMSISLIEPEGLRFFSVSPALDLSFVFEVDPGSETVDHVSVFIDETEYTASLVGGTANQYELSYTTSAFGEYALRAEVVAASSASAVSPVGKFILSQLTDCPVSAWNNTIDYSAASFVYYNGQIYKAKYYVTAGGEPGTDLAWEQMGDCNSLVYPVFNCDEIAAWSSEVVYGPDNTNIDVSYNGLVYRAGYYANSDLLPDAGGPWVFKGVCASLNSAPLVNSSFVNSLQQLAPLSTLSLTATVTDGDGSIAGVDFYIDGEKLPGVQHTSGSDEYSVDWLPAEYGIYSIEIRAVDDEFATTNLSGTINVTASAVPVISNVYPSDGQNISTLSAIGTDVLTLQADVTDTDGTIAAVVFSVNGTDYVATQNGTTWSVDWTPAAYGSYQMQVSATDNSGTEQQALASFDLINPIADDINTGDMPLQIWANLGTSKVFTFNESIVEAKLRNPGLAQLSISGTTLTVDGYRTGRTGLMLVTAAVDTLYLGLRVNDSNGTVPGMPDYQSVGFMSEDAPEWDLKFWGEINDDATNTNMDVRYIYINGGPIGSSDNTWRQASRHIQFAKNSLKYGLIPFFVFYNIPGGNESYETDLANARNPEYMSLYFQDLKGMLEDMSDVLGNELFGIILEPDFLGYIQQLAVPNGEASNDPAQIVTAVGSDQIATGAGTIKTLVERINKTISDHRNQGGNVFFGWQINLWSSSQEVPANLGIMRNTDPEQKGWTQGRLDVVAAATSTVSYAMSAGITSNGADFVSMDKYGFDAEGYGIANGLSIDNNPWWFNADHWNNYLLYAKTVHDVSGKNVVLWQLPVGRINGSQYISARTNGVYPDLPDTSKVYQDSSIDYFLGDTFVEPDATRLAHFSENMAADTTVKVNGNTVTWGSHMNLLKESGIVHAQFGAGVGNSTDGIGFPPEDGWFSIQKIQDYYREGVDWLPTAPFTGDTLLMAYLDKDKSLVDINGAGTSLYYGIGCSSDGLFNAVTAGLGEHHITYVDQTGRTVYKVQPVMVVEDTTAPVISNFIATTPVATNSVDIELTVTDNLGPDSIRFYLSEANVAPTSGSTGWTTTIPVSHTLSGGEGSYTLYLWAMDESLNISEVATSTVVYDAGVPEITQFECPEVTSSLTPSITIVATDDQAVTGYYLVADVSTPPAVDAAGWVSVVPTEITLSEGEHTLYLWVKDGNGNLSALQTAQVTVDVTAPAISVFTIPATTSVPTIPLSITATDNLSVKGYLLKEDNTTPAFDDAGWLETKPTEYTLSAEGEHTLYLWAKDTVDNISEAATGTVVYDIGEPEITQFECPEVTSGLTPSITIVATDDQAVTGYYLVADVSTPPAVDAAGWVSVVPTEITLTEGEHTLYLWVKDGNGNLSALQTAQVTVDVTAPVISEFTIPSTTSVATIPLSITATDALAITGYLLKEDNTTPAFDDAGWLETKPTEYTLSAGGEHTLYLWAKDTVDNISEAATGTVVYNVGVPEITQFECPEVTSSLTPSITIVATDDQAVTGYYLVADVSTPPAVDAAGWVSVVPTEITLTEGEHTLYLWVKDGDDHLSALQTAQVTVDVTAPVISEFTIPSTTSVATISLSITATDALAITGYLLKEDNTTPAFDDAGWLETKPTEYTLSAEGEHTLYLWAKDTVNNISDAATGTVVYTQEELTHFIPVWTGNGYNHMTIVARSAQFNSADMKEGDEIGIFDGGLCVGVGVLQGTLSSSNTLSIIVSRDDGSSNGYTVGDSISYKAYIKERDEELTVATAVYSDEVVDWVTDGKFMIGGTAVVDLNCSNIKTQSVVIAQEWNIVSVNVIPADQNLQTVFQSSIDDGTLVKIISQDGKTLENWGVFGGWKNNIGTIASGEGYYIKANTGFSLPVTGVPVLLPFDIQLKKGWNVISYPASITNGADGIFNQLISSGKLRKVIDESGNTIEDWGSTLGGWKNNIGSLAPGQGYMVYVTDASTITIPRFAVQSTIMVPLVARGTYFQTIYQGNGFCHYAVNVGNLDQTGLLPGDEIGIYDQENCVGSAVISSADFDFNRISIACSADDETAVVPNGFVPGDHLSLVVYHNGEELHPVVSYVKGNGVFERGGSSVVVFDIQREQEPNPSELVDMMVKVYPNPSSVNDNVIIDVADITRSHLSVEIIDIAGAKIRKLYDGNPTSSSLILEWDGCDGAGHSLAPGVYFCKVNDRIVKIVRQ